MLSEASNSSDEVALHQRLLAGDLTASAEIAETYLPRLIHYMGTHFPRIDPHLVETATDDALMSYLQRPEQYDPGKLSLERYLRMSARCDLYNLLTESKRESGPQDRQDVELDATSMEHDIEDETGLSVEEQVAILISPVWQRLQELLPNQVDLEIVLLMMEDIRETSAYATILGITHLTQEEQAREVKRHKDRLKKWLQRKVQHSELTDHD